MEKLLAMSILSASPAEIAGLWRNSEVASKKKNSQMASNKKSSDESSVKEGEQQRKQKEQKKKGRAACFAPEFDGLNCFETFVSY